MKSKIVSLSKNDDFKSILSGKRISNKYLTIFFKKLSDKDNNKLNIRFVTKKKIGNAVRRNKIKRRLKNIMNDTQKAFNELVNNRRGKKLKDDGTIFTGAFWSGEQALELGLIDGIGEIRSVLRERFGSKVKLKYITKKKGFISGILQSSLSPLVKNVINEIDNNTHWKRFGL